MNDIRRTILWVIFAFSLVMLWDQWQVHNGNRPTFFPGASQPAVTASAPASAVPPAASAVPAATPGATAMQPFPNDNELFSAWDPSPNATEC